jgi:GNAT superfamily N-acetyltransferase
VADHLGSCTFDPPLSERVDVAAYAGKLVARARRFEAWEGELLVGLVAAYCNDEVSRQGFITSVSVLPAYSGRGIGTRLMADCIAHADSVGMTQMNLEVGRMNSRAIGVYAKLGFVPDESANGPLINMRLKLGPGSHRTASEP